MRGYWLQKDALRPIPIRVPQSRQSYAEGPWHPGVIFFPELRFFPKPFVVAERLQRRQRTTAERDGSESAKTSVPRTDATPTLQIQ
jgi:hypothetical protein